MSSFANEAWKKISERREFYTTQSSVSMLIIISEIMNLLFVIAILASGIYAIYDSVSGKRTLLNKFVRLLFALFFTPIYMAYRIFELKNPKSKLF